MPELSTAPTPVAPPPPREGGETLVRLTEPAGTKVRALIAREKQGEYLRVAITGEAPGCAREFGLPRDDGHRLGKMWILHNESNR